MSLFLPAGTVYGTALNFRRAHEALASLMNVPPHDAPPRSPVLYIKPANTWTLHGGSVTLPADAGRVWVGATVAAVMGPMPPPAAGLRAAFERVAGYVLMIDLSLPQPNLFCPPVRYNCLDGFLGIGADVVPAAGLGDPSSFVLDVRVDGRLEQTIAFADLIRPTPQLLADVSDFMTLREDDALMLGTDVLDSGEHLSARPGQHVEVEARGFPVLSATLVAEAR